MFLRDKWKAALENLCDF